MRAAVYLAQRNFFQLIKNTNTQVTHRLIGHHIGAQRHQPLKQRSQQCNGNQFSQNREQLIKCNLSRSNNLVDALSNQNWSVQHHRYTQQCTDHRTS